MFSLLRRKGVHQVTSILLLLRFGDDTVLFHTSPKFNYRLNVVQQDFNLLHTWCKKNPLAVNVQKT